MPRCAHCGHEFAVSHGFNCPSCRQDWRGPSEDSASGKPAHLAVLDGPPDLKNAIAKGRSEPKKRLVSSAGPAVPVMKTQNDSVPNGWMARLEAARVTAAQSLASEGSEAKPVPPPPPPNKPPPLEKKKKKKEEMTRKPAHLLVAQLQEDEAKRRDKETKQLDQLFQRENPDAISSMEIAVPHDLKKKKFIPDWAVAVLLLGLVAGGIYGAYRWVKKEPAPVVKVDPKLIEAAEKKKQSVAALEQGHLLVAQKKADAAIEAYRKALALEPALAAAERGLAIAYTSKDDATTAVSHYRRYLELDPQARDAEEVKKIIADYEKQNRKK